MFETGLDRMVTRRVTRIPNGMLGAEADDPAGAGRYERSDARRAYRSGHYERDLSVKAGGPSARVPGLKGALSGSAAVERCRRREESARGGADRDAPGRCHARGGWMTSVRRCGVSACRRRRCRTGRGRCMRMSTGGVPGRWTGPARTCSWTACGVSVPGVYHHVKLCEKITRFEQWHRSFCAGLAVAVVLVVVSCS